MIFTAKKPNDEILNSLKGISTVFLIGCAACASRCNTGNKEAVLAMKEFLEKNNIEVLGYSVLASACRANPSRTNLLEDENFKKTQVALALTCGTGVQGVGQLTDKVIVPALNTNYITTDEGNGVYKEFCSACGKCVLIQTQGICPRTRCPKSLVNGPCGGFVDGKCEVDQTKDCAWVLIYEKLKNNNKLENFINGYIEPK